MAAIITLTLLSMGSVGAEAEEAASVCRGEEIIICVTLLQNGTYGEPVPYQLVEFFDQTNNSPLGTTYTDSLGFGSITWQIPVDYQLGITTVNATFRGNASLFLAPTSASVLLHIISSTEIRTNLTYLESAPGDVVTITAQLLDDQQMPVSEAAIQIRRDSQTIAVSYTNSSGFAHFLISCNASWLALGENTVRIIYEHNSLRHHKGCEEEITIQMQQVESFITATKNITESVSLGTGIEFQITLLSSEGPIASSIIQIMLEGHIVLETVTDHQGNCSAIIEVDDRFSLGSHTLILQYGGSDRYSLCYTVASFFVTSSVNFTVHIPDEVVAGTTIEVNVIATDFLGRAITGLVLDFNDNTSGVQLKEYFQTNSTQITFTVPIEGPIGNHTILLLASGNSHIETSSFEIIVSVWSRPTFTLVYSSIANYAWPGQDVIVEVQLGDFLGNLANTDVTIRLDGIEQPSIATNTEGLVSLSFSAQSSEQQHSLSLSYIGNSTRYEYGAVWNYTYTVTRTIPVVVHLQNYEFLYPMKQIAVNVHTNGLNGSSLGGLRVCFSWLSTRMERTSSADGRIVLHLSLPIREGIFILAYSVESVETVDGMNGSLTITINQFDILASEGLGIPAISLTLLLSTAVVAIPTLIRKIPIG